MAKAKARHRADRHGYTECGRLIEGSNLLVQLVEGGGEPLTCGRCRFLLTEWCPECQEMTLCYRDISRVEPSVVTPHGATIARKRCGECGRSMGIGESVTQKTINRNNRRRRREDKKQLEVWVREAGEQVDASKRRDEAERADTGVLLEGCALCGEIPPPGRYEWQLPPGWHRGQVPYLKWVYCPEHAQMGRELETTLVAGLRKDALDFRDQLMARVLR